MKLRFNTQVYENYAAHVEFTGEYRWKAKPGSMYVYRDLTPAQAIEAVQEGGLKDRIIESLESANDYFEEYVCGWDLLDDSEPDGEDWETPWDLVETDNGFKAEQFTARDHGWSDKAEGVIGMLSSKTISAGELDQYNPVVYVYEDGKTKTYEELMAEVA
jgi:hypothetical protein